jgi:two-component system response regulator FixJ
MAAAPENQVVYIVDDDGAIRNGMAALLNAAGYRCATAPSAHEFLAELPPTPAGCLVLDIGLPGMSGLELQDELSNRGSEMPIIFITGDADVPMAVSAMRKGAIDFLLKPFDDEVLLERIDAALELNAELRQEHDIEAAVEEHVRDLTDREREVLDLVVTGKPNKVIAYDLGVSQRTVEIHRSRVMKKMGARSLAELVRMHLRLNEKATG